MKEFIITEKHDNKRIDRIIMEQFPKLPKSFLFKAFRQKDIKVNGKRIKEDFVVKADDKVEVFIIDNVLLGAEIDINDYSKWFSIAYQDENIIIVNKKQGIAVQPDKEEGLTLIDVVKRYLSSHEKNTGEFIPELCHRIDRNTGGLVMIAKNALTLEFMLNKIKQRDIKKFYICLVAGTPKTKEATVKAYIEKDEKKSKAFISKHKKNSAVEIITKYKVLKTLKNGREYEDIKMIDASKVSVAKLEVELITGKTHQIRAHLAYLGYPIIGDGKYGTNNINRFFGTEIQALWAYKIIFDFKDNDYFNYLNGKIIQVEPEFKVYIK